MLSWARSGWRSRCSRPLKGKGQDILVLKSGVKEVLQFAEYFIAGYILFVETFRRPEWRRRGVLILLAAVAVSIMAAGVQYFSKDVAVTAVRGAGFANRNTFGIFLAVALPLIFGASVFRFRAPARLGVALLLLLALCVVLAGGPFLALCLGLLTVAALRSRAKFVVTAILLLLAGGLLLPRLPRHNPDALLDSVVLYRETDPHHIFRDDIAVVSQRLSDKQSALGSKVREKQPVDYGDVPGEQDFSWKWSQRYKEWQAALGMIVRSPWFGVGAGSYQKNVNQYYGALPKYPKNFMEPDAGSLYAVWGASAGVPFLMILLLMFLHAGRSAGRVFYRCADRFDRGLAAGLLGSLVALAVAGVFGDPLVRGLGVTVALVLALAQALRETAIEKVAQ